MRSVGQGLKDSCFFCKQFLKMSVFLKSCIFEIPLVYREKLFQMIRYLGTMNFLRKLSTELPFPCVKARSSLFPRSEMAVDRSPVFENGFRYFRLALFLEVINSGNLSCQESCEKYSKCRVIFSRQSKGVKFEASISLFLIFHNRLR